MKVMCQISIDKEIRRFFRRRLALMILGAIFLCLTLNAQSEAGYSIKWVSQFPSEGSVEKTSFKERISELVFGRKALQVIKPFNIVASNPQHYWILDQGGGGILNLHDGKAEVLKPMIRSDGEFPSLVGMTRMPGGEILCTDSRLNRVYIISEKGISLFTDAVSFHQPTGIACSKITGEVWIVETGSHQITVFDRNGGLVKKIGGRGVAPGSFNFPTFIWIDNAGRVYVVDSMNFRVQILDQDGNFLFAFGEGGDATGDMARPKGVATDSEGNIYVADALFHVVQIFDREGNYLYNFGGQGQDAGEFWMPAGIYIDDKDFIYVADSYNGRIQVFERLLN